MADLAEFNVVFEEAAKTVEAKIVARLEEAISEVGVFTAMHGEAKKYLSLKNKDVTAENERLLERNKQLVEENERQVKKNEDLVKKYEDLVKENDDLGKAKQKLTHSLDISEEERERLELKLENIKIEEGNWELEAELRAWKEEAQLLMEEKEGFCDDILRLKKENRILRKEKNKLEIETAKHSAYSAMLKQIKEVPKDGDL